MLKKVCLKGQYGDPLFSMFNKVIFFVDSDISIYSYDDDNSISYAQEYWPNKKIFWKSETIMNGMEQE